jgi:hypothetical protein
MQKQRKRAREIAEEGFDRIVEGEEEVGWRMIDQARKIDPRAVEELAEDIERDTADVMRFVEKKIGRSIENP